jgi:hypothetical protein
VTDAKAGVAFVVIVAGIPKTAIARLAVLTARVSHLAVERVGRNLRGGVRLWVGRVARY